MDRYIEIANSLKLVNNHNILYMSTPLFVSG